MVSNILKMPALHIWEILGSSTSDSGNRITKSVGIFFPEENPEKPSPVSAKGMPAPGLRKFGGWEPVSVTATARGRAAGQGTRAEICVARSLVTSGYSCKVSSHPFNPHSHFGRD